MAGLGRAPEEVSPNLTAASNACWILRAIYSISVYGLDFVFCSYLEGQRGSGKHRRVLDWLGQSPVWDPLRRTHGHGSFAVPSSDVTAALATLSQLCSSCEGEQPSPGN